MMNDDGLSGASPFARFVDLSVEAKSADDRAGSDFHGGSMFEERLEREANRLAATRENAGGVNVAVDVGMVGDAVVFGNILRTAPAEKFVLDGFAVGMFANAALTRMALQGCAGFSCRGLAGL